MKTFVWNLDCKMCIDPTLRSLAWPAAQRPDEAHRFPWNCLITIVIVILHITFSRIHIPLLIQILNNNNNYIIVFFYILPKSTITIMLLKYYYYYCYYYNHNYIKILESDWSSTALISALIVQLHASCACNWTVRVIKLTPVALEWFLFKHLA